jgi:Uma2 family endonuclease
MRRRAAVSEARIPQWSLHEFLAWEERQEARYELVDGQPRLMTGGTQAHHLIALNIVATLRDRLRGSPCRPWGSDLRVLTGTGNARYPDALIDCGTFEPSSHNASEPVVIFEVLSRSTAWLDLQAKLRDYDATPAIRHYVVVAQDEPNVVLWARDESGRLVLGAALTRMEDRLLLEPRGVTLTLADIYAGMAYTQEAGP